MNISSHPIDNNVRSTLLTHPPRLFTLVLLDSDIDRNDMTRYMTLLAAASSHHPDEASRTQLADWHHDRYYPSSPLPPPPIMPISIVDTFARTQDIHAKEPTSIPLLCTLTAQAHVDLVPRPQATSST